ncbi:MAG TPA: bifunctional UDP-N-acetylglucosamine diphosphorylase/glucosamine-1-phosphate N-acetyltransferase GlmU [Thermoleophilaceae bacterium]|jgi:bifunctional UDP-N-acetylglucosamine pyrophosphorylase/glucosamine-1-phosphate N-acetyltransferase
MPSEFTVLILAAGHGTRMRSSLPKMLHPVCGRPMVLWVAEAARAAGGGRVVCVTRPGEGVAEQLDGQVELAEQTDGEGTAAAVLAARGAIEGAGTLVVLSGDHPLVSAETIRELVATHERESASATILTTDQLDPAGYGRVIRAPDGTVDRIVESKHPEDATPEELAVREISGGTYAFAPRDLLEALDAVGEQHGERYLPAAVPILRERGKRVIPYLTSDTLTLFGINSRADLMEAEALARRRLVRQHALAGVSFTAPDTVTIDATVEIGEDTTVGPGVSLHGATRVGRGCRLGPHTTAVDAALGDEVSVSHSVLTECKVGDRATLGPFAYLRPGADVGEGAKIGTFVEVKNSRIGPGAKVPHLSYVGDADVGEGANLGASSITANYDGKHKHRTKIGKRANTGVHTSLVAPVTVGNDAYTGAGSVIWKDVPDGALGISRPPQKTIEGWADKDQETGE